MKIIKTNNMKRYLFIFALLLGAVCSYAQSKADQAGVLQKCLDLPALQSSITSANHDQLVVVQSALGIPTDVAVTKFGKSLQWLTKQDMKAREIKNFVYIGRWEIGAAKATVILYYYRSSTDMANPVKAEIELAKTGDTWNVLSSNIEKN
jgi:hypothetical protein